MAEKKNFLPTYRIYDPSDLSKEWFVEWYDGQGKRRRKHGNINHFETYELRYQAAEDLIAKLQRAFDTNWTHPARTAVLSHIEKIKGRWKARTYESYKSNLNLFFDFVGKREVDEEVARAYFSNLLLNFHPTTHNNHLHTISQIFSEIGYGYLFKRIKKVKAKATPARYFQSYQIERIKAMADKEAPELWLFIEFMYYLLMRPNEIRQLRIGDIMLDENKVIVRGEISKNGTTQYVTIPDAFYGKLKPLVYRNPEEYVFPGTIAGKPLGRNTMNKRHSVILKKLGFGRQYKLYSWKHTGAVSVVKAGISLKQLQMQLRHHSLDEVNKYLRQMGLNDMGGLRENYPEI